MKIEILSLFAEAQGLADLDERTNDSRLHVRRVKSQATAQATRTARRAWRRARGLCCECDTPTGSSRYCERHRSMARPGATRRVFKRGQP